MAFRQEARTTARRLPVYYYVTAGVQSVYATGLLLPLECNQRQVYILGSGRYKDIGLSPSPEKVNKKSLLYIVCKNWSNRVTPVTVYRVMSVNPL